MRKKLFLILLCVILSLGNFTVIAASAEESDSDGYKIVGTNYAGDYIISNISVSDYGAKGDGKADDTKAFRSALAAASAQGGGVVHVPAGEYRITAPLSVGSGVTLNGVWSVPDSSFSDQTVLVCDYDSNGNTASSGYFITLNNISAVQNLNIYYARQDAENPVEYPYTIGTNVAITSAKNITLLNSYNGILVSTASHVENIYATCFNIGFKNRQNYEISEFVNLNFSGKFLNSYDKTSVSDIKKGAKDCKAVITGKCDDLFIYGVTIDEEYYTNRIYVELEESIPVAPKQAYGHIFQINGADVVCTDENYYIKVSVEDEIHNVTQYSHQVSQGRFPSSDQLFVVSAYGAKGNNTADDTSAVLAAIDAADQAGGGTVFFPVGEYRISGKISVPAGVELRGAWDSPMQQSKSVLCFYTALPETDAMITLEKDSGLHGFSVRIPDYSYNALETSKYPWIVRGNGSGVWVENLTFINAWNGVDLATNRCDDFLLKGIWGTCMNQMLNIGGGSTNGIIEYTMTTYGTWWEYTGRATDNISEFSYENAVSLTIGNAKNIAAFSVSAFGVRSTLALIDEDGKGVESLRLIRCVSDLPNGCNNVEVSKGTNIAIIGLSTGGGVPGSKYIKIYPTFDGTMRVYGQIVWSNGSGTVIYPDYDFKTYNSRSEDVDILNFDFAWEKSGGCNGMLDASVFGAAAVPLLFGAIMLLKKKSVKSLKD